MSKNRKTPLPSEQILAMPGFLLRRSNQIGMGIFQQETKDFDLTPAQYCALALIAAEPGLDQTTLMDHSALDRSSVTKCVERLEAQGRIERKVDATDRRVRRLYPTALGLDLLRDVQEHIDRAQHRLLEAFSPEKKALLIELLQDFCLYHNDMSRVPLKE